MPLCPCPLGAVTTRADHHVIDLQPTTTPTSILDHHQGAPSLSCSELKRRKQKLKKNREREKKYKLRKKNS
jgi:hypothetical protein